MGFALPNGARVYIESDAADAIEFQTITNATNAVVTLNEDHGLVVGNIVRITSTWPGINDVVTKIIDVKTINVTLGNLDTSDTNEYPAGGSGTLEKIIEWTEIPQVTEVSTSGGEQQFTQIQFLSDDRQRDVATVKSPKNQVYTFAHDSALPAYPVLRRLNKSGTTQACYMYVPKATENRYWSASVTFDDQPQTAVNDVEKVTVTLAIQSPLMMFFKLGEQVAKTRGKK